MSLGQGTPPRTGHSGPIVPDNSANLPLPTARHHDALSPHIYKCTGNPICTEQNCSERNFFAESAKCGLIKRISNRIYAQFRCQFGDLEAMSNHEPARDVERLRDVTNAHPFKQCAKNGLVGWLQ